MIQAFYSLLFFPYLKRQKLIPHVKAKKDHAAGV